MVPGSKGEGLNSPTAFLPYQGVRSTTDGVNEA